MRDDDRQIRVFISSTFRDMKAERDYLVKFTFPQLRKLCNSRGVTWSEVDLRWGITSEQAAEGQVLSICLDEIQRCRPYFIAILGERYGWVPQSVSEDLIAREPWLRHHLDACKSVTELEILHAVLNRRQVNDRAFFYFRDPTYAERMPEGRREDFLADDVEDARKLHQLKQRIRNSGCSVVENFSGPEDLGRFILEDMCGVLDRLFPEGSNLSPREREGKAHDAFARSRYRLYTLREEYTAQLDEYACSDSRIPLVVVGSSGSGKSALLADWTRRHREAHTEHLIVQHYVEASSRSASRHAMLRRMLEELQDGLDLRLDIPSDWIGLQDALATALYQVADQVRVVLVLDGINHLNTNGSSPDPVWVPESLPVNVRIILSTTPDKGTDYARQHHWHVIQLKSLTKRERLELMDQWLVYRGKALSEDYRSRIASAGVCSSPLYLRVLLNELRHLGEHEGLSQQIDYLLEAGTIERLFEKVIIRWENDYEGDTDLVGDALSALWASHDGLSEAELLDILGSDEQKLPQAVWSPLYLAMEDHLILKSGLLRIGHEFLRNAARDAYIPTSDEQHRARLRIADYIERIDNPQRKADELVWMLAITNQWPRLARHLTDLAILHALWDRQRPETFSMLRELERNTRRRLPEIYSSVLSLPEAIENKEHLWTLADILNGMKYVEEAYLLYAHLAECPWDSDQALRPAMAIGMQATMQTHMGNLQKAVSLHREEERRFRNCHSELGRAGLARALGNQALTEHARGNLDASLKLHEEEIGIFRELGATAAMATACRNTAALLLIMERHQEAGLMFSEAIQAWDRLGNPWDGQVARVGQGVVRLWEEQGYLAADILDEAEQRLFTFLNRFGGDLRRKKATIWLSELAVIYLTWAQLLETRSKPSGAMILAERAFQATIDSGSNELMIKVKGYLNRLSFKTGIPKSKALWQPRC